MRAQGVILNEFSDMDMRSASSSLKTGASSSPSVSKQSYNSSTDKDEDEKPLDCPMFDELGVDGIGANCKIEAPSDEEGEEKSKNKVQQQQQQQGKTWELKDGMVQVKVPRGGRSSMTEENKNKAQENADKHPSFENARLKWDNATAQLTKQRVDRLGTQSWHGKRGLQDMAPFKSRSAPRNSLRSNDPITSSPIQEPISTEKTESANSQPTESGKNEIKNLSPSRQTNGNAEQPNGNKAKESEADEQSIAMPTTATARSKFAAMSESANFESSTTSFLAELPKMPRRWKIDDDASSVVRGGRVYKIQGPSTTKRSSYSTGPSKWSPTKQALPSSNSIASRTLTTGTSSDSSDDDDMTEYGTVVPLNDREKRGSVERTGSGSSVAHSIATFADFDMHYPLETVPSAGSKTDPAGNAMSVESGQKQSEHAPLKDTESYRKAKHQEDEEEEDNDDDDDEEDYEEDLQDAEPIQDNRDFVVDKVPAKKRWTSKNIHNFPVWPPIIKVQTWDRRNVSAVSIGSGFSFDESLTNSNAVVSSLGDDDISYEEEEFVRRPPEHRTSYRIRYDGPTSLRLEDIYKTPIADSDGRFESTKRADGLPIMPARRVTDSAPSAPPRISTSSDADDVSVSLSAAFEEEGSKRPDVWITPVSGSLPTEPVWKVRRVWAVEDEDEKEQDHAVGNHELFEKIRSLVGARDGPAGTVLDNAPQLPQRSWHVRTIVEKRGRLENVEAEKSLDVTELEENIKVMAEEAVKEIASNQRVFEEYKTKRELQKAEEELMQDLPQVESDEEFDDPADATRGDTSVPVDDIGDVTSVPVDDVGEVGSVKGDDVDDASIVNANDADEAAIPAVDEVAKAAADTMADDLGETASDKGSGSDAGETITHAAEVDETANRSTEGVIQVSTATTTTHVDSEMQPNTGNDTMVASHEESTEGKRSANDKEKPATDFQFENDDETVMDTESVVYPTTSDVSEKKTKKKKKREISPKSSPKGSKDVLGDESAPSTPVTTKQKRRSSTTTAASTVLPSPPTATPKKSKSKTKSGDVSALVSPKRISKSSKELLTTGNISPVQPESNTDASRLMTPKTHKSKVKVLSPKPKSPKREKSKGDTIRKGRKSTTGKEEKETETPQIKKKVISLAQLVRNGTDSSDDDSAGGSGGIQSARRERQSVSKKVTPANKNSPEPPRSARLSLAAMVHDTDSENEESSSDDDSIAASIGPRIVQQATNKSPRRAPGWWNTPGGTKRRSIPLKGTRPISPPLDKSNDSNADSY